MPAPIKDKFSKLSGISRQRRYQLRHVAAGLCEVCNRRLYSKTRCYLHWKEERERYRLGAEALKAKA